MSRVSYLTTREASAMLRRSTKALERWRTKGTGPRYIKMGGIVLYDPADIEAFVDAGRRGRTRGEPEPAKPHQAAAAVSRRPSEPASTQNVSPRLLAKTRPWNVAEHLHSPAQRAAYLEAVFEEGDTVLLAAALGDVAQATDLAGPLRGLLSNMLSSEGGINLTAVAGALKVLGLQLRVLPSE
ncbi:helix-turn-helix domain-containing protein [Methylopila sp. 73B]|uniref:helix-turn-helix domain-containing protein n=1 Tax=Methylopila sp. 73B TaxID=1120792 RepID=UPI0003622A85|nr:helix-turn-helix domain-containing protein [Methylopila sp. 73B]